VQTLEACDDVLVGHPPTIGHRRYGAIAGSLKACSA
jgi:hypothetical protein